MSIDMNMLPHEEGLLKPIVTLQEIERCLWEIYGLKCASVKELNGYVDNNYHITVQPDSLRMGKTCNGREICLAGYVFKIINSVHSKNEELYKAQTKLLLWTNENGISGPVPVPTSTGLYCTQQNFETGVYLIMVFEYIVGTIFNELSLYSFQMFYEVGRYAAKLDVALKDYHHPAYRTHKFHWMLESVPTLSHLVFAVEDEEKQGLIREVFREFTEKVLGNIDDFERGMIHGDFNEQNIVVERNEDGDWGVKAVLDFGDCQYSCYLFELAITLTYMILEGRNIDIGRYVISGYTSVKMLPKKELMLLKLCIAARLCQSMVLGAYASSRDPGNSYLVTTPSNGWNLLRELWLKKDESLLERWGVDLL